MSSQALLPSANFPDFLQGDWQVGTPRVHPLANALDVSALALCNLHTQAAYRIHPQLGDEGNLSEVLSRFNLRSDTLTLKEKRALRGSVRGLFRARGTLAAVETLAEIYFGEAKVQRGFPYQFDQLASGRSQAWGVGEAGARDRVVFVRLLQPSSHERLAEFQHNAQTLLSEAFQVEVGQPGRQSRPGDKGLRLNPVALTKRRL